MAVTTETAAAASTTAGAGDTTKTGEKAGETTTAATATGDKGKEPGDKGKEPAGTAGAATQTPKAPEKYSLTLPDGGHIDAHDLATIETIARAQDWTNEEAQQRVTEHAASIAAQSARFLEDTKSDATYGGGKLTDTLQHANRALDKLRPKGTPRGDAFRALLDKSGYGNHVEVVSLLADLGKAMAEDGTVGGPGGGGGETKDPAELLYGKSAAAT